MKKRLFSIVVMLCMVITLFPAFGTRVEVESAVWDGTVAANFDRGSETEDDPYQIATAEQL